MSTVLIVDDDTALCALLNEYLTEEGFVVSTAHDGVAALAALRQRTFDIALLDVMMPGKSGFDVLRDMREFTATPVLMLTARGEEIDRIVGLEIGADDYVGKPCNPREIVARLRAILRRSRPDPGSIVGDPITIDDIELRRSERAVRQRGASIDLTSTEYDVLEVLLRYAGQLVTKEALVEAALHRKLGRYDRSLDMHVSRLRRKLGPLENGLERIKTVRGIGYQYVRLRAVS